MFRKVVATIVVAVAILTEVMHLHTEVVATIFVAGAILTEVMASCMRGCGDKRCVDAARLSALVTHFWPIKGHTAKETKYI